MRKRDQPHDRYFKDLMQDIELARAFLQIYLAKDIQEHIAWDTLTPYDTSLTGNRDKQLYTDVAYKALTKDHGAEIFIILNHERKPDELLPVKMLEYALATLRKAVRQKKGKPAFMISLTVYNGPQRPYPHARRVFDYFGNKQLAKKLLLDAHYQVDLGDYADHELASHDKVSVLELFMKHADNPSLPKRIEAKAELTKKLAADKYIERSLRKISDAGYHRIEDLLTSLGKVSEKQKEDMLTTAQQIRQEGIEQGIQQEKQGIAKEMLQDKMSKEQISKWTGLDLQQIEKLSQESFPLVAEPRSGNP